MDARSRSTRTSACSANRLDHPSIPGRLSTTTTPTHPRLATLRFFVVGPRDCPGPWSVPDLVALGSRADAYAFPDTHHHPRSTRFLRGGRQSSCFVLPHERSRSAASGCRVRSVDRWTSRFSRRLPSLDRSDQPSRACQRRAGGARSSGSRGRCGGHVAQIGEPCRLGVVAKSLPARPRPRCRNHAARRCDIETREHYVGLRRSRLRCDRARSLLRFLDSLPLSPSLECALSKDSYFLLSLQNRFLLCLRLPSLALAVRPQIFVSASLRFRSPPSTAIPLIAPRSAPRNARTTPARRARGGSTSAARPRFCPTLAGRRRTRYVSSPSSLPLTASPFSLLASPFSLLYPCLLASPSPPLPSLSFSSLDLLEA